MNATVRCCVRVERVLEWSWGGQYEPLRTSTGGSRVRLPDVKTGTAHTTTATAHVSNRALRTNHVAPHLNKGALAMKRLNTDNSHDMFSGTCLQVGFQYTYQVFRTENRQQ